MTAQECQRLDLATLADYAAGELPEAEATALEAHLFTCADCGARAASLDALLLGIGRVARDADVEGFVTEAVLNRLARDGVRMRTYALSPGDVVPCAVWDDDELMVLRLRADLEGVEEVTVTQRANGEEMQRATTPVAAGTQGELIHVTPASVIRQFPVAEFEVVLSAREGQAERALGRYTLVHGGAMHRR